jgi:hypothetical protein
MSSLLEDSQPPQLQRTNQIKEQVQGPNTRLYGRLVQGLQTDLVITNFTNKTLLVLTQLRKLGTVLEISRDSVRNAAEGSSGRTVYTITTLLGSEDEEILLFARILAERLNLAKPVLLTLAVKQLDNNKIRELVNFVAEKFE